MRNTTRPPRRPAQPSLRVIHLTAGWGLHLTTFECSQSSASSRFLLLYASVLLCDIYYTQLYSNNLLPILDAPTARI